MPKTKICTQCNQLKAMEMFAQSKSGKGGLMSRCRMCVAEYHAFHYKNRKEAKPKPVLMSWQPQPGDIFDAYLSVERSELCPRGLEECVLNPFVCERNDVMAVISTVYDSRWKLPKSEYIFLRPN